MYFASLWAVIGQGDLVSNPLLTCSILNVPRATSGTRRFFTELIPCSHVKSVGEYISPSWLLERWYCWRGAVTHVTRKPYVCINIYIFCTNLLRQIMRVPNMLAVLWPLASRCPLGPPWCLPCHCYCHHWSSWNSYGTRSFSSSASVSSFGNRPTSRVGWSSNYVHRPRPHCVLEQSRKSECWQRTRAQRVGTLMTGPSWKVCLQLMLILGAKLIS